MREIKLPIQTNPLLTKDDVRLAFQQLSEPLAPYLSKGKALLQLGGGSGASFSESTSEMEGFCRVLWGMVPLLAGGGHNKQWEDYLQGIINGTDPQHDEYWGEPGDYDQRLVEMAVIGMALSLIPEHIWEPLDPVQKQHLYEWLNAINHHPVYDCNWLLFHVLVNMGFRRVGLPYDEEGMERNLDRLDAFDLGGGWYADGVGGHSDYYVPFALHYYGLVYAKLMESEDPYRSKLFKERAVLFAQDFINWFSRDGSAIPYGRSLTYRFAQSAFWSALAYAEVEIYSPGVVKGIVLRNLRWWFEKQIYLPNGVLSIGYTYPNLVMAENYNSPGSPYWALKTFLILALPDDHAFWQAEELPLPALPERSIQQAAHLAVCREEESGHVVAFNTGHHSTNEHTHTSAKYEKFAYSTAFGFSVPRAEWGLAQGAFDSMLALSEGDNLFRVRRCNEEYTIEDNVLFTRWKPWHDVEVRTWIVAGLPWHVRVHRIETKRVLTTAEGGFALVRGEDLSLLYQNTSPVSVKAACSIGVSGICGIHGFNEAEAVYPHANTNLLYSRTIIPTLKAELVRGVHWLVSAVYGRPGAEAQKDSSLVEKTWEGSMPGVTVGLEKIHIRMANRCYNIDKDPQA